MAARHRKDRQQRRLLSEAMVPWVPMLVGVAIMAGYVIYAFVLLVGDTRDPASRPNYGAFQDTPPPWPATTSAPTPEYEAAVMPPGAAPPRVSPPPPSPPPPPPVPSPAPPPLEATYRLEAVYRYAFIGKVEISNPTDEAQDWTVELEFPDSVGRLNTFWVDGTPQPTKERDRDRYIFTSTVPVEANSTVVLKFHFNFYGRDITPTLCTVDGNACEI